MADEQTPQSDLIEDALRQAERQLEERLEALRMSALGETQAPSRQGQGGDVAVLRPTSTIREADATVASNSDAAASPAEATRRPNPMLDIPPAGPTGAWGEAQDAGVGSHAHAPEPSERSELENVFVGSSQTSAQGGTSDPARVLNAAPTWDDEPQYSRPSRPAHGSDEPVQRPAERRPAPTAPRPAVAEHRSAPVYSDEPAPVPAAPEPQPVSERPEPVEERVERPRPTATTTFEVPSRREAWERPEPVHSQWTGASRTRQSFEPIPSPSTPSAPSEDELQFWAATRTALRNLEQVTDDLPTRITGAIVEDLGRTVRDEAAGTIGAVRQSQQNVQQGITKVAEQLEGAFEHGLAGPTAAIRQIRDDLPVQIEHAALEIRHGVRDDLDRTASAVHGAVQKDVAQLEGSIAQNVTRMSQSIGDGMNRVERGIDGVGDTIAGLERHMNGQFDHVEGQLRTSLDLVEQGLREELTETGERLRRMDEELPSRFAAVEGSLTQQVLASQRDLSAVLGGLVDANRASLDRIAAVASTLDEERTRRTEDIGMVVDTVTSGWEGLAGAMKALFEQGERIDRRVEAMELRFAQLRDLEGAVEAAMERLRAHVADLTPAPIVVTVAHADAEVQNTSRAGWIPRVAD